MIPAQAASGYCCVWPMPLLEQTPWPLGPLSPAKALQEINQPWPWGSDWSWLSRANTKVTYKPQVSSPASVCSCFGQGVSTSVPLGRGARAMQSLGALPLLLAACVVVSANPVPTLPDIQVQENFDISRVRLASLGAMAGV